MREILKSIDNKQLGKKLQHLRNARGLTQQEVADRLAIARTTLTAIEKGERLIRSDELTDLSKLYNEPVNRLLRQDANTEPFAVQFRAALVQTDESELELSIQEFQKLCEDYHHLEQLTATPLPRKYPPEYVINNLDPLRRAEDISSLERNRLGLGDSVITNLKNILENEIGIRIFGMPLPSRVAGLLAFTEQLGACIATNTKHPKDRQLMSSIHEYAHFLTTRLKADVVILRTNPRMSAIERFADAFARFFLMPSSDLQRRFHEIKNIKDGNVTAADLLALADFYSVSFQALILRLEELRLLRPGTWDRLMNEDFQVRKAQEMLGIRSKPGGSQFELPYRYQALAVQAYDGGDISEGQLARLLRTDRVRAREIVEQFISRYSISDEGEAFPLSFDSLSQPITEVAQATVGRN